MWCMHLIFNVDSWQFDNLEKTCQFWKGFHGPFFRYKAVILTPELLGEQTELWFLPRNSTEVEHQIINYYLFVVIPGLKGEKTKQENILRHVKHFIQSALDQLGSSCWSSSSSTEGIGSCRCVHHWGVVGCLIVFKPRAWNYRWCFFQQKTT